MTFFLLLTAVGYTQDGTDTTRTATGAIALRRARLPLTHCRVPGLNEDVLCGTYEVYENRASKTGRKIPLNIVVIPALSPTPAPDPLFVLVGGPGQAATDSVAGQAERFAAIRRTRDIVLVDQRGTGRSNRLGCDFKDASTAVQAWVAGNIPIEIIKECREQLQKRADLSLYTTPIAMDDLDEVRAWLGYEKINLYGGSYGTRPALVYLKQHPEHVRTVTLRGVYAMNPLYFARDTQQSLDRLEQSPAKIKMKDPWTGKTIEITITRDSFAGAIRRALYDSGTQRSIPWVVQRAMGGDFQPFENVARMTLDTLNSLSMGMGLSVNCVEGARTQVPFEDVEREAKGSLLGVALAKSLIGACGEWPRGKLPADYFEPVRSDVPVLILSGTIDPVTPPSWGDEVAKYLPNSLHLKMESIAHSPFPACAVNIMNEFVSTGSAKGLNTACIEKLRRPPFVIPRPSPEMNPEAYSPIERELIEAEQKWMDAVKRKDRAALSEILLDEFAQSDLKGWDDIQNKTEWIDTALSLANRIKDLSLKFEETKVHIFGDTAIVNSTFILKGEAGGGPVENRYLIIDVWNKRDGRWQVAARHLDRTQ